MEFSVLISTLLLLAGHSLAALASPGSHHDLRRDSKKSGSFSLSAHYNPAFHSVHHDQPSNHGLASYYKSLARLNIKRESLPFGLKDAVSVKKSSSNNDKPKDGPAGASSSLPTTPFWEEREYLTPLTVGTPPQSVLVNLDTGSISFWVLSSETFIANKTLRALYDIGKSTTAEKVVNASWASHYADGSYAAGNVYHDTLRLGAVEIPKAVVQSALEVSLDLASDLATSGIMGLSYNMSSEVHPLGTETTIVEQLYERLTEPLMTVDLRTAANGTYSFGVIPPLPSPKEKGQRAQYKGDIHYFPLSPSEFWQTQYSLFAIANATYQSEWMTGLENFDFNTGTHTTPPPGPTSTSSAPGGTATSKIVLREAIIDTGTSIILLPDSIVDKYYSYVPGAVYRSAYNVWTYPCDLAVPVHTRSTPPSGTGVAETNDDGKGPGPAPKEKPVLPDFKVSFGAKGGYHATVPGSLMNFSVISILDYESADGTSRPVSLPVGGKEKKGGDPEEITVCMGGIQSNMGMDMGIFGDTFLKAVFVVLDMRGRVGFADKEL
ncbi:aspartic peptidase domain-containing protein [Sordaria brevicollis]|uniref:Aspartic peptidase domain-containing protein n=1 Tax=Sordaria brevicollis TaxID=83679 RepID=A0AAE0PBB4_SORBR|nr:aspartic peptidase domain-containing protein [Sordaria brevicollis]